MTLTHHCRKKSKKLTGLRSTDEGSSLLKAINCPKKLSKKKNREGGRRRERQTKNDCSSVFDLLASYIFFALGLACGGSSAFLIDCKRRTQTNNVIV